MKAKSIFVESLTTAALTDSTALLYTVPNNTRAKLVLITASNSTGASIADLDIHIKNNADVSVMSDKSLTAGERVVLDFDTGYVMLEAGYEIRARAAATGVSCIITVEETTGLVSTN